VDLRRKKVHFQLEATGHFLVCCTCADISARLNTVRTFSQGVIFAA
jgi:hypothetical protein